MTDLLKIVLTGPESSGKTTLAASLADYMHARWVPEFARDYLTLQKGQYGEDDLVKIAAGQIALEDKCIQSADAPLLFFDTNLLTVEIWGKHKYGRIDPFITRQLEKRIYDMYFLCCPEMVWEYDPLRENPADRWELFNIYERRLKEMSSIYFKLQGINSERIQQAGHYLRHEFGI